MNNTYQSPFTWRYGSKEMKYLFSEEHKYTLWRKIWVSIAAVQHEAGLVSKEELLDLESNKDTIDIDRICEIEKETKHDVVAAVKEFAEKAKIGGGKIHLGATSMDIVDNTDMLRMKEGLELIEAYVRVILNLFVEKIEKYADTPCIGYTHLQPAEPTTVGYRFAFYAQDLLVDYNTLQFVKKTILAKGMKGAVGTAAGYVALFEGTSMKAEEFEQQVMARLGLDASIISTQVYTRKFDYLVLSVLNSIASTLAKFAADLRILQSPNYGEWSEPFGKTQVGSSAMPFKKNPINSEKICSLARYIAQLPTVALENATHSYLERTLDDSANKRIVIAESFLAVDEILQTTQKLLKGMIINPDRIAYNLEQYAPFAASEAILMACVKKGGNRQELHEVLRTIAMQVWENVQKGKENTMQELIQKDKTIQQYLSEEEMKELFDVKKHIGNAPERALKLVKEIQQLS